MNQQTQAYLTSSVHCHSTHCDGVHSLAQMAQRAYEMGLTTIGFSGHSYMPRDEDCCMSLAATQQYAADIAALQAQYQGRLEILFGIEWDACSGDAPPQSAGYDYWIGSVHCLADPQSAGRIVYPVDWKPELLRTCIDTCFAGDALAAVEAYFDAVAHVAMQKPTILGHFDLIKKLNRDGAFFDETSPVYRAAALRALEVARANDCVLELNTGGVYRGYRDEFYPSPLLLGAWHEMGGKLIITADTHNIESITFGYEQAAQAACDAGFTSVEVLRKAGLCTAAL